MHSILAKNQRKKTVKKKKKGDKKEKIKINLFLFTFRNASVGIACDILLFWDFSKSSSF
jgi:hypothetical protein